MKKKSTSLVSPENRVPSLVSKPSIQVLNDGKRTLCIFPRPRSFWFLVFDVGFGTDFYRIALHVTSFLFSYANSPKVALFEMDSVGGRPGGRVILDRLSDFALATAVLQK